MAARLAVRIGVRTGARGLRPGSPTRWERLQRLGTEHRALLDDLETGLAADVAPDDAWGPEAWRRVDAVLDVLDAAGR